MNNNNSNFDSILLNPARFFTQPKEVLKDARFSEKEKKKILKQWQYDELLLNDADDQNMCGGTESKLQDVLNCLRHLNSKKDRYHS